MLRSMLGAAAVASFAGAAGAATVEIQSIEGTWEALSSIDGTPISGEGTNLVTWGIPKTDAGQSGYRFDATTDFGPYDVFEVFEVGTFTHLNNVLKPPYHVDAARLTIEMTAIFDGVSRTFSSAFDFDHWETPNEHMICANGEMQGDGVNVNGCADRVQLISNPSLIDVFTIGDLTYTFELTGFLWGEDFWTVERRDNSTPLLAQFFVSDGRIDDPPDDDDPPVVPLPGAVWGMIAGMGGLWAVRRRRRA